MGGGVWGGGVWGGGGGCSSLHKLDSSIRSASRDRTRAFADVAEPSSRLDKDLRSAPAKLSSTKQ